MTERPSRLLLVRRIVVWSLAGAALLYAAVEGPHWQRALNPPPTGCPEDPRMAEEAVVRRSQVPIRWVASDEQARLSFYAAESGQVGYVVYLTPSGCVFRIE